MTTAETAWAEAMKFDNRADPYPFFDELRKTPVARVAHDTYVVTGYRELMALAHDPRISSDISRSPLPAEPAAAAEPAAGADHLRAYGRVQSIIMSDPPDHDRARRQVMRHFGPPHSPDVIPKMEPDIQRLCNELLDNAKAKGETRLDVVDDYAYPVPVAVICKILGVPLKDEPTFHGWIFDALAGLDLGPRRPPRRARPARRTAARAWPRSRQYLADLIEGYLKEPGEGLLSKWSTTTAQTGRWHPKEAAANADAAAGRRS